MQPRPARSVATSLEFTGRAAAVAKPKRIQDHLISQANVAFPLRRLFRPAISPDNKENAAHPTPLTPAPPRGTSRRRARNAGVAQW